MTEYLKYFVLYCLYVSRKKKLLRGKRNDTAVESAENFHHVPSVPPSGDYYNVPPADNRHYYNVNVAGQGHYGQLSNVANDTHTYDHLNNTTRQ